MPIEYIRSFDLDLLSSKALEEQDLIGPSPAVMLLIEETLRNLKTGVDMMDVSLPSSVLDRDAYAAYLNAFRMELVMTGLWDLHNVLRGSIDPFRVCRAASEAEGRLALLHDRLLAHRMGNE